MADKCEFCNSAHGPDEYSEAWFVVGEEVVNVKGEGEALQYGLKNKLQIFWSEAGANDALQRASGPVVTNLVTGKIV